MPTWLVIAASLFGGLLFLAGVFVVAAWPGLVARPKKPWMPEPSGDVDYGPIGGSGPSDN